MLTDIFQKLRGVTFALLLLSGASFAAEGKLTILPSQVTLTGSQASQQLLLQRDEGGLLRQQVTEGITWTSSQPEIAEVSTAGIVTPKSNGVATLTATAGDQMATVQVTIQAADLPRPWTFRNDVLPILSKAGCNMGACHGALAGKGGFRLSLRGYDPQTDFFNVVKQDRGRRVEFSDPGRSLFLTKPSGGLPHKGGLRIPTDSRDYAIIADWIAQGAAAPAETDPSVKKIEILPSRVQLKPGHKQQMVLLAYYSDDHVEDVSHWVKWTSANDAVCQVNDNGVVTVVGPGEGAITGWFSSQIAVARVTVPFANDVPADIYAQLKPRNFIDEEVNRQLQRLNLPPSPLCDDATFVRRAYLDTIGLPPTDEETQAFLADVSADKRDKLIDKLLARPEFVDYWTYKWSDVLMLNGTLLRPDAIKAYYKWVHTHVEKNTPWDAMVREILTATGSSFDNGATNFYALFQSPEDMTENACQAFMGLSLACAKCHNHPLEKWTNDQYYGMANLFSRVRAKGWGGDLRNGDGQRTLFVVETGELVQPRTGQPQPPTPLDGKPIPFDDLTDRRVHLANWMVAPENPYFAKSITNRVWANFFGVGLVESIDDMRVSNPASNEELLNRAAAYVVAEKFNLKNLMREILRSQTYQRSSVTVPGNEKDLRFYSRYFPRRLNAEVLHDSVVQATRVPTKFEQIAFPGADFQKTDFYPVGTRAIQLYDAAVDSYFLKTFGRNQRNIVCECERSNEPSMVQVLHLSNGSTINDKLTDASGRAAELSAQLQNGMAAETLVDEAYLSCLSRYPTSHERREFVTQIEQAAVPERRQIVEDLFWALLSSREFVFNH
ncbi:DUF1549 domain-containing protein [Planctomicrobium piriforme]|uniref:Ig-like domain (Group 2) n=1 Tax=Planctomicrobium piriforme TaxID=1576369 RepID=A0A1I3P5P2_9PLAN|nr:DUF1549 domain-containing protein [Planctomicrobium piriforme]SFJ16366.1 Ig-like domain (group 2) [Planctomicrobium piriforme]